ncbi:MAG: acyl-CoA/acyl-ACP dehydrogenase [Deltaproteobacteria bacterium]|nr:acyl-CoA/acyl-ACP dehydrogenase [Deltaproteobacteria bacterium]
MNFALDEQQRQLRDTARAFLAAHAGPAEVRAAMTTERGFDPGLWRRIAGEMGWPAVVVPEEHGGLGLGQVELMVLMEAMGAALLCAPFFSTVCLGANALVVGATPEQRARWLPGIAAGTTTAALAHTEPDGRWDADGVRALARVDGGDVVLSGTKSYVVDGHTADLLLIAARAPGTTGAEGVALYLVPATTPGLGRRALATLDQTRRLAEIVLDDVRVPKDAVLGGEPQGWEALAATLRLATVALAAEQVGGAERCLDLAVAYAGERVQFGRPIGSFQAIKHKCADMLMRVEAARSATYYAACTAEERGPELAVAASLAKAYASDTYFQCAADCMQVHGGVGFTWEYDVHLYFKRARSSESLLGDGRHHRELVARYLAL